MASRLVLSVLLWWGGAFFSFGQTLDWQTDAEAARAWSAASGRPLLLLADGGRTDAPANYFQTTVFTSDWPLEEVARQTIPVRLAGPELDRYQVRGFPTLLLVSSDGRLLRRWEGPVPPTEIRRFLADLLLDLTLAPQSEASRLLKAGSRTFRSLDNGFWQETDGARLGLWAPVGRSGPLLLLRSQETGLLLALPPEGGQAFVAGGAAGLWLEAFWLSP